METDLMSDSTPAQAIAAEMTYRQECDISYLQSGEHDAYAQERCRLDLYYPEEVSEFPTVVWFHAGGMKEGEKEIPEGLKNKGLAIASVNYRLSPHVQAPAYLEDAARAVAWVFQHIASCGGSNKEIIVAGHSAGAYLTLMLGLDPRWLGPHEIEPGQIRALIAYSGQVITHVVIREEQGVKPLQPTIDAWAPLYHVSSGAPPLLLLTGDREQEMLGRYEENAYFCRMMQLVGHPDCSLIEIPGYDHGAMVDPGHPEAVRFMRRVFNRESVSTETV
jgi:acetyl esterase/lipase